MRFWSIWIPGVIIFGVASIVSPGGGALGQTVENPGFKALPRPVNYATPLMSFGGEPLKVVAATPWLGHRRAHEPAPNALRDRADAQAAA